MMSACPHDVAHTADDEKIPIPLILRLGLEVAQGLQELHQRGFLYEDLKPAK
jgi:serine/threonine protein kinase